MTEFVDNETKEKYYLDTAIEELAKSMQKCIMYAKFIRQPLTLGMFVPVDEKGNVLKKPTDFDEWFSDYESGIVHGYQGNIMMKYKEAKEKVLFEVKIKHRENFFILEDEDGTWIRVLKNDTSLTVEDLLRMSSVNLTPAALKEIGL